MKTLNSQWNAEKSPKSKLSELENAVNQIEQQPDLDNPNYLKWQNYANQAGIRRQEQQLLETAIK